MQNTSINILLSEIKDLTPKVKKVDLIENHIGSNIVDLITFKPKRFIMAKVCNDTNSIVENQEMIFNIKVIKHYPNFYNRKLPYKIGALFKDQKVSLIFFSKFTGYLRKVYPENQNLFIRGKVEIYKRNYQILHPEIINSNSLVNNKVFLKVIYKQRKNLKSSDIHSLILDACKTIPELNEWNHNLFKFYKDIPSFRESIVNIHNPRREDDLSDSSLNIIRLAYDEIFSYQLSLAILRNNLKTLRSNSFKLNSNKIIDYIKEFLPFSLTEDQEKASLEIIEDIKKEKRTLRLLQGDVGSGKTIVAAITAFYVLKTGFQVAILVPTELLAKQHYKLFNKIFHKENINLDILLSSSLNKKKIKQKLYCGDTKLVIGTHALLQDDVLFNNLSYAIIDEQHRFGVEQRIKLRKKGNKVDMLLLTATPIPRTMMLTVLGDISVSTIHKKPFNSKINTILKNEENINQVISFLNKRIYLGEKVFWVCPKIDDENQSSSASIEKRFTLLNKIYSKSAMLHGKMTSKDKSKVLEDFRAGNINLIVSTVVIEVGIDIPDANIIVIDNANVFGLAQIHQLRGRVGRGEKEGSCILLYQSNLTDLALERLAILKNSQNGFEIAEKDLELRGSGELMGTKQYGAEDFKFFNYESHFKLAQIAIDEAREIVESDPLLKGKRGDQLINLLKIFKKTDATNLLAAG